MKRSYLFSMLYCAFLIIFLFGIGFAQITWQRNYGGTGSEVGHCVDQTTDGGYIVVGNSNSFGNSQQVYLVKTDSLGDTLWAKNYGGVGYDIGYSIQQTTDGGYIVTGSTNSYDNGTQLYLLKFDCLGDTLWTKTYGDTAYEIGRSVHQTADSGYIITGFTNSYGNGWQVYLVRTDSLGDSLWIKTFGGPGIDKGWSVEQTPDRGYIIGGGINSLLVNDPIWILKTDSLGDTLWTRIYGTNTYIGRSVQLTQDGGYIVIGYDAIGGSVYLAKTDANGDSVWTKDYHLPHVSDAYTGLQTSDKGYVVGGMTREYMDYYNFFLVRIDSLGDTLWTKYYGSGMTEGAQCVQQTTDGGYILVGTNSDLGNAAQIWLIKTDQDGNVSNVEDKGLSPPMIYKPLIVRPNPFYIFTAIIGHEQERFVLYDITGRKRGTYLGERVGFDLAPGIYFIQPENKSIGPVKIIKLK